MLLTVFFNDGSFLCGLLSWGFAGAAVTCVGNYKRGARRSLLSWLFCVVAMLLQWFEMYHRIAIHDLSAVEDTILAPVIGSVVLIAVSAGLNILAYVKYTKT